MNISLSARRATIEPNGSYSITVEIENADQSEILDNFNIDDIVSHFSIDDILNNIGREACISHFDIEIKED